MSRTAVPGDGECSRVDTGPFAAGRPTVPETLLERSVLAMAKILVVDDSKFSRNRAIEALRNAGHEVFEAPDGQIGLEQVATHDPDCVLLDMLMPVLDRWRTNSEINRDLP